MADKDGYRRYLDAAAVLGHVTRARAEEIVREMMGGAEVPRAQAQQWVDEIVERGKKATEELVEIVRSEVSNQLEALGLDPDELARNAADILRRSAEAGRRVVVDAQRTASRSAKSTVRRAGGVASTTAARSHVRKGAGAAAAGARAAAKATSKRGAKKAAATKETATSAASKKAPAKKAPAKKAAAKKSTGKKAVAKKAAAKKRAGSATSSSSQPTNPS